MSGTVLDVYDIPAKKKKKRTKITDLKEFIFWWEDTNGKNKLTKENEYIVR